ncbi:GntR family transcriptional regulator [Bifidobacterium choerinum]|uniref:GntR family transcriptional regulator n=2 Tax=Bifidobacterium choerinum TaxID=35760 RepID=A0A2D3D8K4_9BIFI|nr:GntR family transcriptional regulator [Bifidobacterium choerinum]
MDIVINAASMTPIYEQIVDRIRALIKTGDLRAGDALPSVRALARQCAISALTVKKAYDVLEQEGLVVTVQGKGTFVAEVSPNIVAEELNRQMEEEFAQAITKARRLRLDDEEIMELVTLLLDETDGEATDTEGETR